MRHAIESMVRSPLAWLRSRREEKLQQVDFWALRNVSFQITPGEVVGIVGSNGAGKSTLLKIASRITIPTDGWIRINGRSASLIEVGTGFHQELTGRENIFLNGSILGMSHAEITRKFDEIVEFSGVEEFLDTPVKRYSSGMYVRLAFAVAAHLEPEILIVDEVLAVGDNAFQKKCLGKMGSFAESGRTVVFVSHSAEAVRTLCKRCIWLRGGQLHKDGKVEDVLSAYFDSTWRPVSYTTPDQTLAIQRVVLKNERGEEKNEFRPGDDLIVELQYDAQKRLNKPYVLLRVRGADGSMFAANMLIDGHLPEFLSGSGKLSCRFKSLPLLPQNYFVTLSMGERDSDNALVKSLHVASFGIEAELAEYGFKGDLRKYGSQSASVVVPYEWQLPDGTIAAVSLGTPRT